MNGPFGVDTLRHRNIPIYTFTIDGHLRFLHLISALVQMKSSFGAVVLHLRVFPASLVTSQAYIKFAIKGCFQFLRQISRAIQMNDHFGTVVCLLASCSFRRFTSRVYTHLTIKVHIIFSI